MKINILHIMQSLEPGGLENGVVNLANYIDKDCFEVHIYCIKELGRFRNRISDKKTDVRLCQDKNGLMEIAWDIRRYCKKKKIDIVHTHGWGTLFVGVLGARLARVAVINGEHGVLYDETFKRRFAQYLLFNNVNANLSVSEDLIKDIAAKFSIKKSLFKTIHNGIDLNKFFVDSQSAFQKKRELGINQDTFIVGTVGRLDPIKHFHTLISAFAKFRHTQPNISAKLIIVGDGIERQKLQQLSDDFSISEDILLLGHRDDIPALLNMMDIFVLTSESEGLSNTIMEAMACGAPVLATDVGGNRELVVHGETGGLFPVDDIEVLAKELSSLYFDKVKRGSFSINSVARVQREFSIEIMVKKYENFYASLLKKGRS